MLIGYTIVSLIAIIYFCVVLISYYRENPTYKNTGQKSTVTHTCIGKRGDMGNQIFQLSCLVSAATSSGSDIILPSHVKELPIYNLFDLSLFEYSDVTPDANFYETSNYEDIKIPQDGKIYNICGYRQCYKYFDEQSKIIKQLFIPKPEILDQVKEVLPDRYIAVHIRRGDYIKPMHKIPLMREFTRCQLEYYKSGIKLLRTVYPDCPLLICTDSPEWVKPLLSELEDNCKLAPIIENISPKYSDYCVLYLANGVVISNSTFSWMAAYLNNNDNMVICPSPWWDPDSFIGTAMGLNGPYLHYPKWWLLDPTNGHLVRKPNSMDGELVDTDHETLLLYKMIRGIIL